MRKPYGVAYSEARGWALCALWSELVVSNTHVEVLDNCEPLRDAGKEAKHGLVLSVRKRCIHPSFH